MSRTILGNSRAIQDHCISTSDGPPSVPLNCDAVVARGVDVNLKQFFVEAAFENLR